MLPILDLNLAYLESDYSDDPAANRLFVARSSDGHALFAPWMDDFLTYALGQLVDLGFTRAVEIRDWKAGFIAGRLGSTRPNEYCYNLAATYRYVVGTSDDEADFWPDFKTLYEQNHNSSVHSIACGSQAMANWQTANLDTYTYQPGQVSGRSWSATGYYANAQPAAAIAVDAGVATEAQWNLFANGPVVPDYNDNPIWAIVPRVLNSTGQNRPKPPTDFRVVE